MTLFVLILLKFSLTISAIWFFYKLFLEKLTFFVPIRYFFLGSIGLACIIATTRIELVDALFQKQMVQVNLNQYFPSIQTTVGSINTWANFIPVFCLVYSIGLIVFGFHFVIQFFSYLKLKRKAHIREIHGQEIYVVNQDILPFSFGKSIFISENVINNHDIRQILLHESIHIKQGHSLDIILAELVRIINWINPFAHLIKKPIQQNLEFLTDAEILGKGIDKKHYQYQLLHFSGNNPFSLVTNFNFHSLKSRISKMNQNKSNRFQYVRFLLFIPLVFVLLVGFRFLPKQTPVEVAKPQKPMALKAKPTQAGKKPPPPPVEKPKSTSKKVGKMQPPPPPPPEPKKN